ncbi:hypothetical protein [Hydrogenophaga sp. 2FB]|uniref:hypothetical protein n=1 Tax=Hydrogenophaga sp. 2FB TaxID=2502187 RepID=UPI0010F9E88E|nr:hypothetical protein [Hydrogenophaga sp. 2FB]
MRKLYLAIALSALTGCASMLEGDVVYYLDSQPIKNQCFSKACRSLDNYTAAAYARARSGQMSWVSLVDGYYRLRDQLYRGRGDTPFTAEIRSYQRALAEQIDFGKLTETQWVYLQQRRINELNSRQALIESAQPRETSCISHNTGTPSMPSFHTVCK